VGFYTTANYNLVDKWRGDYYVFIAGFGILKTRDFETYTTFWQNMDASDMMMDAHGNILVRELNNQQVHYYINPD
jgi:hypothetical protein